MPPPRAASPWDPGAGWLYDRHLSRPEGSGIRRAPPMFDALFQALFSYRPVVFQQGEFRFDLTGASLFAAGLAAVAAALAIFTYRRVQVTQGRPRDRAILTALRLAVLGLVLFCLFRPALVVRAAVNQQNVVAVLLDDSSSMQLPDAGGKTRGQWVQDEFGSPTAPLLKSLGDR